jgi:hypothetical protein
MCSVGVDIQGGITCLGDSSSTHIKKAWQLLRKKLVDTTIYEYNSAMSTNTLPISQTKCPGTILFVLIFEEASAYRLAVCDPDPMRNNPYFDLLAG